MNRHNQKRRIALPALLIGIGVISGLTVGIVAVLLIDKDDSGLRTDELYIAQSSDGNTEDELTALLTDKPDTKRDIPSLIALLESVNRVERLTVLYNFLDHVNVEDLEILLKQSDEVSSSHLRSDIQKALIQGLATHDPMRTLGLLIDLDSILSHSLIGLVFQEWAVQDLDQAVAEAAKLSEPKKQNAVEGILTARFDLPESDRRAIARQLGHEQLAIDQIASAMIEDEILSPQQAWERFINRFGTTDTYSTVQQSAIAEIAQAWIAQDGNEALKTINDFLQDRGDHVMLVGQILENIARDNPHQALEMSSTIELRGQTTLSRIISSAAALDPRTALDAASSFPLLKMRERLQQLAITSWVASAPLEVLNELEQIPSSVRQWSQIRALRALAKNSPKTAASFLATVEDIKIRESVAGTIVQQWAKHDYEEVLQWVNSNSEVRDWKESLHTHILRSLAQEDVQLAMKLALDQPISTESEVGTEAAVIEEVARFNVDEAISLLNSARNQETVQQAHKVIGLELVVKGRSDLALELVAESPPEVQYEYFDNLAATWGYNDPEDMFEKLDHLPTEKIAENLGTTLAAMNDHVQVLTSEQKKELAKYLPAAMRGLLE